MLDPAKELVHFEFWARFLLRRNNYRVLAPKEVVEDLVVDIAVVTDILCNGVVPVRAVTTLWLHLLLKLWCWSNTIENVDPEVSSNVVQSQRL